MIITKPWLQAHRTKRGGWTKAQADILGLEYPLTKGWIPRIIGKELSELERKKFELAKDTASMNKVTKAMNTISRLSHNEIEIIKAWLNDRY